jgi:hypothetical protein
VRTVPATPPIFSQHREHTTCPKCGAHLVRVQDGGEWTVDRLGASPERSHDPRMRMYYSAIASKPWTGT